MSDIDSDSEDFYDALCDSCRYIRVAKFFVPPGIAEFEHEHLSYIIARYTSCSLCRLIGHAIHTSACAQSNLPPPLPSDLSLFKPKEMFPDMTRESVYLRAYESRWTLSERKYIESLDEGIDVAYQLGIGRLYGRPFALRLRIVVELGILKAVTAEIEVLSSDTKYLRISPSYHAQRVEKKVDIGRLRNLINSSCSQHPKCQSSKSSLSQYPRNIRLIDTLQHCISYIDNIGQPEYVALSYTWGGDQQFKLLLSNVSQWSQPGCMPAQNLLPHTIRDTIHICRQLEKRYLWIDSLCIVQDDPSTLRGQLEQMSLIYQCAEFTIIAASGTGANAGLPGVSTNREPFQLIEKVQGLHLAVPLPSLSECAKYSFWKTRAWTYQEQMLSGKMLVFTERQMYFECTSELFNEDSVLDIEGTNNTDEITIRRREEVLDGLERLHVPNKSEMTSEAEENTPFNSFHLYRTAVATYTTRNLGNLTDILNAFTGVADAFQKYTGVRGFVGGLSVMGLTDSLLWRPEPSAQLIRRPVLDPATGRPFPTWSWAGWIGAVTVDRESDIQAREMIASEWVAIYQPLEETEATVMTLPSIEIDEHKDDGMFSQWKLLHAHALRLRTSVSCDFEIVIRPLGWDTLCHWDTLDESRPHRACILDKSGTCIGSIVFDNQKTASELEEPYILLALSKGWHPKTHYTRQFTMQQEGGMAIYNILVGARRSEGVERRGIGKILVWGWAATNGLQNEVVVLI